MACDVRMNSIMERWVQTCRHELFDRTLIWNQAHLLHALAEFEAFYNQHRPHRTPHSAAPCGQSPNRSPTRTDPTGRTSIDVTDLAASFTSTHTRPRTAPRTRSPEATGQAS